MRSEITDGDLVHVERTRGELIEATVKRIRNINGKWELHPESTDPAFQKPVTYDPEDTDSIEIIGIVVASYTPL